MLAGSYMATRRRARVAELWSSRGHDGARGARASSFFLLLLAPGALAGLKQGQLDQPMTEILSVRHGTARARARAFP